MNWKNASDKKRYQLKNLVQLFSLRAIKEIIFLALGFSKIKFLLSKFDDLKMNKINQKIGFKQKYLDVQKLNVKKKCFPKD